LACSSNTTSFDGAFLGAGTVVQGIVLSIRDASIADGPYPMPFDKVATLVVDKIWKGRATVSEKLIYTESTSACGFELQLGQPITVFAQRVTNGKLYASGQDVAGVGVHGLDTAFLVRYRMQTSELRERAQSGGVDEGFAFGEHLTHWNDDEALAVYNDLLDRYDRDAEAYLGLGIALARNRGDDAESVAAFQKAAAIDASLKPILESALHLPALLAGLDSWNRTGRAILMLTGEFDDRGSDWSGLVANKKCASEGASFWNDYFDASDMRLCSFRRSSFDRASFAGAKLAQVPFDFADLQEVNFSGANLGDASFTSARMRNITWTGASLRNADFSGTQGAGPFQGVEIKGAKFDKANNPGPFLARQDGQPLSLEGVSFHGASLSVYAFLTEDGYWPTAELQADISRADFTGANLDCGDRDELHLKQSLDAMPDSFLPRFLNEQRVATFIRDNWPDVTLTERCQVFVDRKLQ
jgi:uncharacterized protein YjbI with pentapeptide repeats